MKSPGRLTPAFTSVCVVAHSKASGLVAQDALLLAYDGDSVGFLRDLVVQARLFEQLRASHVVILILVLLQLFRELLLAELLQSVSLRLQLFLQDFHFLILLFLQFDDLQADLILAKLFGLDLLLSFEFLNKQLRIICLVINFLVGTFFLNASKVNNVLCDSDSNSDSFLEVLLHLD